VVHYLEAVERFRHSTTLLPFISKESGLEIGARAQKNKTIKNSVHLTGAPTQATVNVSMNKTEVA
jgi:hypothetical protein